MSDAVKEIIVPSRLEDGDRLMPASAVFPVDPNQNPIVNFMPTFLYGTVSPSQAGTGPYANTMIRCIGTPGSWATATGAGSALLVMDALIKAGGLEGKRTPDTFKHVLCTTIAATTVWDPAAGKRFRLMGYVICPDAGLAAAGIQLITFLDEAAAITIAHQTYLPIAASIIHQVPIVVQLPGNGYLSSTADNNLNVTLTSACTAGAISVMVYGTEE